MDPWAGTVHADVEIARSYTVADLANSSMCLERWLASDESLHVTGQVFRAVGDEIARYEPWNLGTAVKAGKKPQRWDAEKIGEAVNVNIFGTSIRGLQLGR